MAKGKLAQAAWDAFTPEEQAEICANAAKKMEAHEHLQSLPKAAGLTLPLGSDLEKVTSQA